MSWDMKRTKDLNIARIPYGLREGSGSIDMKRGFDQMRAAIDLFLKGAKNSGVISDQKLQNAYTDYMHAITELSTFIDK